MSDAMAFLSAGKLMLREGEDKPVEHSSTYAKEMVDRALALHQKRSWKMHDEGNLVTGTQLWGVKSDPANVRVVITACAQGNSKSEIVYALSTEVAGGLFTYDLTSKTERRLFHKEGLKITDLARRAANGEYACSTRNSNGTASISLVEESSCNQLTEGDCVDEAPSWVPGDRRALVYHSAGIGRNQSGVAVALGPFAIHKLDLENGEVETLVEDNSFDCLTPRIGGDGTLYYIKRPYEQFRHKGGLLDFLKDLILFPFRLIRAFMAFLDVFSMIFTSKSLTTAGGPKNPAETEPMIYLRGRLIQTKSDMAKSKLDSDTAPLVPLAWELVARRDGKDGTLARGVVSFDLDEEGNILFTNGRAVYRLAKGGKPELVVKSSLIEHVLSLGSD